ncbi:MAG: hypothetical protein DRR19_13910 [Candidatus Parabeggiatoa sp. nov. 1]|nr:MAG: hypothetical protein DRR19_13910 [Gammaproteobacteria bacterium]
MKKSFLLTFFLLIAAFSFALVSEPYDHYKSLAVKHLGEEVDRIDMPGLPAFQNRDQVILFFSANGVEGLIEGAVVIKEEKIKNVLLMRSREGLDHNALDETHLALYRERKTEFPVVVEAISGATVSSRILVNATNERIRAWRKATGRDKAAEKPTSSENK